MREKPSYEARLLFKRLPGALKALYETDDMLGLRERDRAAKRLVKALDSEFPHTREGARDCLRALYDRDLGFDPAAPPEERKRKQEAWMEVVRKEAR
ncbi:MAG: hypothetical protein ACYSX0_22340 [Planctomycetota bacterium]